MELSKENWQKLFNITDEYLTENKNPGGTIFFRHIFTNNMTEKKHIDQFIERLISIR